MKRRPAAAAASESPGSADAGEESSSDSEIEFSDRVWGVQDDVSKRLLTFAAWTEPPRSKSHKWSSNYGDLAKDARKLFGQAQNQAYWVDAQATPRTMLERFALDVFWFHVVDRFQYQAKIKSSRCVAGAEYWVQRRTAAQPKIQRSINWHFDKDERLLDDFDLTAHPCLATVTYLSDCGAPLLVLTEPILSPGPDGAPLKPINGRPAKAFMVYPTKGRHVAFHGNLLHGCPAELEARKGERLSLLVNVWLHHKPVGLHRAPLKSCSESASTRRPLRSSKVAGSRAGKQLYPQQPRAGENEDNQDALDISWNRLRISGVRVPKGKTKLIGNGKGLWEFPLAAGQLQVLHARTAMKRTASSPNAPRKRPATSSRSK